MVLRILRAVRLESRARSLWHRAKVAGLHHRSPFSGTWLKVFMPGGSRAILAERAVLDGRREKEVRQASSLHAVLSVGAVTILALALRLLMIDYSSLWWDEGYSLWFSRQSVSDLFGVIANIEPNPPLYYLLLKLWIGLFGDAEFSLRSLSAVYGAATVPLVYLSARWMAPDAISSHRIGILAAIAFSLSFLQLLYGQEARAYTQFVLALAGVLASATYILRVRCHGRTPSFISFGCLGLSISMMLWSHYIGVIYAGVLCAATVAWWLIAERADSVLFGRLCATGLCVLILAGPPIWMLINLKPLSANEWIKAPSLHDFAFLSTQVFSADFGTYRRGWELAARIVTFGAWPVLGIIAIARTPDRATRAAGLLMILASIGVFICIAAISYLAKPILLQRTVMPVQLGWAVLCSFSLIAFSSRYHTAVAGALLLCFGIGALSFFVGKDRARAGEDWPAMVAAIRAQTPGTLQVVTDGSGGLLMNYYLRRYAVDGGSVITLPDRAPGEFSFSTGETDTTESRLATFLSAAEIERVRNAVAGLSHHRSAWLVLRRPSVETVELLGQSGIVPLIRMDGLTAFRANPQPEGGS